MSGNEQALNGHCRPAAPIADGNVLADAPETYALHRLGLRQSASRFLQGYTAPSPPQTCSR